MTLLKETVKSTCASVFSIGDNMIKQYLLKPFSDHRKAFSYECRGDLDKAENLFIAALYGFDQLLQNPEYRLFVEQRAQRVMAKDSRAAANKLVGQMPGWLLGVHYDRALRAFATGDMETAVIHWRILLKARSLTNLDGGRFVEDSRARIAIHFLGADPVKSTMDEQTEFLGHAERLLTLDPRNSMVRSWAVKGYSHYLHQGMEDQKRRIQQRRVGGRMGGLPRRKGSLIKAQRRLRIASKKLRKHLRYAIALCYVPPEESARYGIVLGSYYALTGQIMEAWRLARRSRFLAPEDPDVMDFYRWIKLLKKRMRR